MRMYVHAYNVNSCSTVCIELLLSECYIHAYSCADAVHCPRAAVWRRRQIVAFSLRTEPRGCRRNFAPTPDESVTLSTFFSLLAHSTGGKMSNSVYGYLLFLYIQRLS